MPELRTGSIELQDRPARAAAVVARARHRGATYLELSFPIARLFIPEDGVEVVGGLAVGRESGQSYTVLARFPGEAPETIDGILRAIPPSSHRSGEPRWRIPLTGSTAGGKADRTLPQRWAEAMAANLHHDGEWWSPPSHPWYAFAAGRVRGLVGTKSRPAPGPDGPRRPRTDLAELMATTTAATSLQEALQYDRGLRLNVDEGRATVPLSSLKGPALEEHPFDQMRAALKTTSAPATEPLAASVPADFWYVRFDDIRDMLRLLDEADAWITPVSHVLDGRAEVHDLATRYQTQLGLGRSGLAEKLGHTVVRRVAVVGSDPYLREGSDVTMLFELANPGIFDAELARHLAAHGKSVPSIAQNTISHGAHTITLDRDPTGRVRRHRATVGSLAIVSNSEAATKRVLDAIDGRTARLSDEPDLAYMLARDPASSDAFAFVGDRFVASVVGPRQKIAQARRQLALSELLVPGYAALLYGWLQGEVPDDAKALVRAGLIGRGELEHGDGAPIELTAQGPRSRYGTPASLTPLIDLPAPTKVTPAERDAYGRFVQGYESYWRTFIDPIAVRLDMPDEGPATLDVRVLPLIAGSLYHETEAMVGHARVEVPPLDDGVQGVWAVGEGAEIRRELDQLAGQLFSNRDVGIGWLGDWVMLGALDRRGLPDLQQWLDEDVQLPAEPLPREERELGLWRRVGALPVYAVADVRNPVTLVATLAGVRKLLDEVAPDSLEWGEHEKYRGNTIVRVGISPNAREEDLRANADAVALYYVQAKGAIAVALDEDTLRTVIDRFEDGHGPKSSKAGMQATVQAQLEADGPLWTSVSWLLQARANEGAQRARRQAEIVLRGRPSLVTDAQSLRSQSLAFLGGYPVTPSGTTDFSLQDGAVGDPLHGSAFAPAFPPLPVADSPIEHLLRRLIALRGEVAFDTEPGDLEPPPRSLHTRFSLTLGD